MPYSQQEWSRPDIHTSGSAPAALPQACSNQTHFLHTVRELARRLQEGITALGGGVVDGVCRRLLDEPASFWTRLEGTPAAILLP